MNSVIMVGLGKMGGNMARRLSRASVRVIGIDPQASQADFAADHITLAADLNEALLAHGDGPAIVWLMLPHGEQTHRMLENIKLARLEGLVTDGSLVIDGANAQYEQTQKNASAVAQVGLGFIDCGVSGGVWGLANGYCLMMGGQPQHIEQARFLFEALAPSPTTGWLHCGPAGSGHYTKMIHNGIEYGMMQAMAEGFALMQSNRALSAGLGEVASLWQHGSVVRSWLLDLTADALNKPDALDQVGPVVSDSGEGRWAVAEAIAKGVPTPTIAMALMSRFDSQGQADAANKILALMRKGFGGHAVTKV
jgi:6-phosphogluconate dehydrogenase